MSALTPSLPRLNLPTTALSASVPTLHLHKSRKLYDVFPSRLCSAPDIPKRINPLAPCPPQRRTTALETVDAHWHNDQRSTRMKQREHYRHHNAWSKYYYGSAPEQEQYRAYTRAVLKQQMSDSWSEERQKQRDKVRESEQAVAYDQQCLAEDFTKHRNKTMYLKKFTDHNKQEMENIWKRQTLAKHQENLYDREQLKYNPINWSCTLK